MTLGAIAGGKCLAAVVADTTGLPLQHFRHDHFGLAFLDGKRNGMALIALKDRVTGMMEIDILHWCFIFQLARVINGGLGGRLILVTTIAVVKCGATFRRMTGEARFPVVMIIEINFSITLPISKCLRMAGKAAGFELMFFMFERNRFSALSIFYCFRRGGRGLLMASAAICPGKRIFALLVMTGEAVLLPAVISHFDTYSSFFGFKHRGMTALAACFLGV